MPYRDSYTEAEDAAADPLAAFQADADAAGRLLTLLAVGIRAHAARISADRRRRYRASTATAAMVVAARGLAAQVPELLAALAELDAAHV